MGFDDQRSPVYHHERIGQAAPKPKSGRLRLAVELALVFSVVSLFVVGIIYLAAMNNPNVRRGIQISARDLGLPIKVESPAQPESGQTHSQQSDEPKPFFASIEYTKPVWDRVSESYMTVVTEVMNTSDEPLEFLRIEANFYDKNDVLVKSETPYIDRWQRLGRNDRSPAQVHTTFDPRIKSLRLRFTCKDPRTRETVDVFANQVAKLK